MMRLSGSPFASEEQEHRKSGYPKEWISLETPDDPEQCENREQASAIRTSELGFSAHRLFHYLKSPADENVEPSYHASASRSIDFPPT